MRRLLVALVTLSCSASGEAIDPEREDGATADSTGLVDTSSIDTAVETSLDTAVDGREDAVPPCRPVRHLTYPIAVDTPLNCKPPGADVVVFTKAIPERGRALARLTLELKGVGPTTYGVHGWSGYGTVGDLSYPRKMTWGAGEDLCPGEAMQKSLFAFGALTDSVDTISFSMHSYRSAACQNGVVTVSAGSKVDVWVEDPQEHCRDRDIVFRSYFQSVWDADGAGANKPVAMTTDPTVMVDATITTTTTAPLRVLAQTEISPSATLNRCGDRFETGFLHLSSSAGYSAVTRAGFAPSEGMTHVLIAPEVVIAAQPPGSVTFKVAPGVDQTIRVGALAGATFSGDTFLVLISERP
jgi:hypothetical protein